MGLKGAEHRNYFFVTIIRLRCDGIRAVLEDEGQIRMTGADGDSNYQEIPDSPVSGNTKVITAKITVFT